MLLYPYFSIIKSKFKYLSNLVKQCSLYLCIKVSLDQWILVKYCMLYKNCVYVLYSVSLSVCNASCLSAVYALYPIYQLYIYVLYPVCISAVYLLYPVYQRYMHCILYISSICIVSCMYISCIYTVSCISAVYALYPVHQLYIYCIRYISCIYTVSCI